MKNGAVAIIDALGFKGIWKKRPPDVVLGCMMELKRRLDLDLAEIERAQPHMQFQSAFLSDTIAVALSLGEGVTPDPAALSVIYVTDILSRVLSWSARSMAPLAYRGVVAYGEYELRSSFTSAPPWK